MNEQMISQMLLEWFLANARPLPWRQEPTPYTVWVSEVMAQQTQMDRVVPYFERFMARFPDIHTLAAASEDDVFKLWEGLGYYSRARNLQKAARQVVNDFSGVFPNTYKDILSLAGVGPYTAGAILSIAYNHPQIAVDANVERVIARLFDIAQGVKEKNTAVFIRDVMEKMIAEGAPRQFTQAIMEFGALVCKPRNPECIHCPLKGGCLCLENGTVLERPLPSKKAKSIRIAMATGVLLRNGKVYIQKRKKDDVWPGLWEFPGGVVEKGENPECALEREFLEETELPVKIVKNLGKVNHSYTRFRVTQHCYLVSSTSMEIPAQHDADDGAFVLVEDLTQYAFPAGHRMLREKLLAFDDLNKYLK
ncbi:MAG: A/G-specific adenine glycosylase [Desulfovibrio sp.]